MEEKIKIFVDGACSPNPGTGGIGAILMYKDIRKEISEGYMNTTNSRMELLVCIRALQLLKKSGLNIDIYSDSRYVVNSVEKGWLFNWEKNGFIKRANADLWIKFLELYRQHNIKFLWVKGHSTNEYNNLCDELAVNGRKCRVLLNDKDILNKKAL